MHDLAIFGGFGFLGIQWLQRGFLNAANTVVRNIQGSAARLRALEAEKADAKRQNLKNGFEIGLTASSILSAGARALWHLIESFPVWADRGDEEAHLEAHIATNARHLDDLVRSYLLARILLIAACAGIWWASFCGLFPIP